MCKKVQEAVNRFMQELQFRHPDITLELLDERTPWVDARIQIKCDSDEELDEVMETAAHLNTKYYLDEGVYIHAATTFGPPPSRLRQRQSRRKVTP